MSNELLTKGSSAPGPRSSVCPLCGVFLEPTGILLTGDTVHSCADHGCYVVGPSTYGQPQEWELDALPRLSADLQPAALRVAFTCLLAGTHGDYLLVDDLEAPGQYVQLEIQGHGDGTIYVEVGSREWAYPHRPLRPDAIAALHSLGFTGGGFAKNYSAEGFFPDPDSLTRLTQRLFAAAYPESAPIQFVVVFKKPASAQACIDLLTSARWVRCRNPVDFSTAA